MARFNEETPNMPDVRYFSYGAEFNPSWSNVFKVPWAVVYEREGKDASFDSENLHSSAHFSCIAIHSRYIGANDGLVSVDSAKWGEYQATLHNVNHLYVLFSSYAVPLRGGSRSPPVRSFRQRFDRDGGQSTLWMG